MIEKRDRWHLIGCRTLHFWHTGEEARNNRGRARVRGVRQERGDGVIAWGPYTDHEPVEIVLRADNLWQPEGKKAQQQEVPDWRRMLGPTREAEDKRIEYGKQMDEEVPEVEEEEWEWEKICEVSHRVALDVLGRAEKPHPRPWQVGREQEKAEMDEEVTRAQATDRVARTKARPWTRAEEEAAKTAREELKGARKRRRQALRAWENKWWEEMGER